MLVRPRHGLNSSNGREIPSVEVRLYRFTVTMVRFEKYCHEAMKKDFTWLALHSDVQNKITATF